MACMRACSSSASDQGAGALASPIRGSCTSKSSATSRRPGAAVAAPARAPGSRRRSPGRPRRRCPARSPRCSPRTAGPSTAAPRRPARQPAEHRRCAAGQACAQGRSSPRQPQGAPRISARRATRVLDSTGVCGSRAGRPVGARRAQASPQDVAALAQEREERRRAGMGGGPRLAARPARPRPPALPGSDSATLRRQQARGAAFL